MLGSNAEDASSSRHAKFNISDSLRVRTHGDGVFGIRNEGIAFNSRLTEGVEERINRSVAARFKLYKFAAYAQYAGKMRNIGNAAGNSFFVEFSTRERVGLADIQEFALEQFIDFVCSQLSPGLIAFRLNNCAEFGMHGFRHVITVIVIHNERSTTLAGLAVDADNRLVFASDVGRIGKYGISQYGDFDSRIYSCPLLIAS